MFLWTDIAINRTNSSYPKFFLAKTLLRMHVKYIAAELLTKTWYEVFRFFNWFNQIWKQDHMVFNWLIVLIGRLRNTITKQQKLFLLVSVKQIICNSIIIFAVWFITFACLRIFAVCACDPHMIWHEMQFFSRCFE